MIKFDAMIAARGLSRSFRTKAGAIDAVRDVDVDLARGEIVGFLGPNGAGKTTTLRMLTTLLAPSSGEAQIAGHDLRCDPVAVRRRIGYVAQGNCTAAEAYVGEELVDQGRLYGLEAEDCRRRAAALIAQLDLEGSWQRPTKTLSGGQRRRLDIAMGLIHDPPLLFLDEPTTGLDPQARANLWEHVRRLRDEREVTVFLTTHYLEEADALCDRILIIDAGRIVAAGTPAELKRDIAADAVALTFADAGLAERAVPVIAELADSRGLHTAGATVRLELARAHEQLAELLALLERHGIELAGVEVHRPTLDDVFLSLTGRALRDESAAEAPVG
jgi:ABC-2 type transport system ATP-binding protein